MLQAGTTSLKDKVSNLSDFPVLMAATHSDPNPTPSHLSQRVVSISFVSRQKCVHLMEHLLDIAQANSKSLHSRIKAVRLLQELVMKGDPEFQPLLQKEEHKLKAVSYYQDPQAPVDSARLREATASLLEDLFEETIRSIPPPAPFLAPDTSKGFVSPSYNRSQYQGFGNPHFVQQRSSSSSGILSLVSDKVSDLLTHLPPSDPNRFSTRGYPERSDNLPSSASGYAQNSGFYSGARHSYPINSRATQLPQTFPHTPGTPGVEWDSSRPTASPPLPYAPQEPESVINGSCERGEVGHLERQLVFSFTAEGGVRNRPSRQELEEFIARSRCLDCSLLAELLASQIGADTGSKLKTLFALEALYRSFSAQIGEIITAHSQAISCVSMKGDTPAVRTKAKEIMSLLGISSLAFGELSSSSSLIPADSYATSTPVSTDTLVSIDTSLSTDTLDSNTLIPTETKTLEVPNNATTALVSTQPTDSLFDGMLTSQPEESKLISGLEEFALPEPGSNDSVLSDMINLGTTNAPCIFDPLLEIGHTSVPTAPQTQQAFPPTNLFNYTTASTAISQSYPALSTIQNQQPAKAIKTDSFGFISEHIHTLKEAK